MKGRRRKMSHQPAHTIPVANTHLMPNLLIAASAFHPQLMVNEILSFWLFVFSQLRIDRQLGALVKNRIALG
jgi:hypothetical protein